MDAHRPNKAAFVDGHYWLVTVSFTGNAREKRIQRASATDLAGPWTIEPGDLISRGGPGDFDEKHADAVSGFWFEEFNQFVYYYMGYPDTAQPWSSSPFGNAIGVATQQVGQHAKKLGPMLLPSIVPGHWASGYLGGLQLLPGTTHRWIAVLNASPSKPDQSASLTSEEPPPSLGGLAFSDSEFPTEGWVLADEPFEWIEQLPERAIADGEGVNLWRQHIVIANGVTRLFYNSGSYGVEQMYSKELAAGSLEESLGSMSTTFHA